MSTEILAFPSGASPERAAPEGAGGTASGGRPVLVGCSHGTSDLAGRAVIRALLDDVRAARPDLDVREAFVDVQQPDVAASLAALPDDQQVIIVPLLLSAGYHVRVDLKKQSAGRAGVTIAPALGPDPRLAEQLATAFPANADRIRMSFMGLAALGDNPSMPLKVRGGKARLGFVPLPDIPPL